MKGIAAILLALAGISGATPAAQAQTVTLDALQFVAQPATVRANDVTLVEMLWQITNGSETIDQRIGITGCTGGEGELIFIERDGARMDPVVNWRVGNDDAASEIARVTCEIASRL